MSDGGSEAKPMVEPSKFSMSGSGEQLARSLHEQGEKLKEQFESIDERTRTFVHEHPLAAVGIAAMFGFVVARIASRW